MLAPRFPSRWTRTITCTSRTWLRSRSTTSYALVGTITANGSTAESIAVDALQDIYIVSAYGGLSLDDPYGDSLYSYVFSVRCIPSRSANLTSTPSTTTQQRSETGRSLRYGELQEEVDSIDSAAAGGSACSSTISACWYGDSINNTLTYGLLPGNWFTVGLSYTPGGRSRRRPQSRVRRRPEPQRYHRQRDDPRLRKDAHLGSKERPRLEGGLHRGVRPPMRRPGAPADSLQGSPSSSRPRCRCWSPPPSTTGLHGLTMEMWPCG